MPLSISLFPFVRGLRFLPESSASFSKRQAAKGGEGTEHRKDKMNQPGGATLEDLIMFSGT